MEEDGSATTDQYKHPDKGHYYLLSASIHPSTPSYTRGIHGTPRIHGVLYVRKSKSRVHSTYCTCGTRQFRLYYTYCTCGTRQFRVYSTYCTCGTLHTYCTLQVLCKCRILTPGSATCRGVDILGSVSACVYRCVCVSCVSVHAFKLAPIASF